MCAKDEPGNLKDDSKQKQFTFFVLLQEARLSFDFPLDENQSVKKYNLTKNTREQKFMD